MSKSISKSFICPHCNKRFQWTTRIADRKAQCPSCSKRIRIPTVPGRVAEAIDPLPPTAPKRDAEPAEDTYDLDLTGIDESIAEPPPTPAQQAAAETGRCPACNQSINPGAVICIKCGYNLRKGKRMQTTVAEGDAAAQTGALPASIAGSALANLSGSSAVTHALNNREDEIQENRFMNLWMPLIMLVLGIGFTFFDAWWFYDPQFASVAWYAEGIISSILQIVVMAPLMLVAAIITVKIMDTSFGPLMIGVLKLTAIAVGPLALADFILGFIYNATLGFGVYFSLAIYISLCGPFLYWLFDLDFGEIMVMLLAIVLLRLFLFFGILAVVLSMF